MGGILGTGRNAGVEEVDYSTTNAYRYPPKSGCYFGSYFIMGGERFDTTQPEAYLFGENQDLNFLGNRPIPFPYPAPQANEPTKTLKSLVNIRKDSLKFVKVAPEEAVAKEPSPDPKEGEEPAKPEEPVKPITQYNIEFTFDTDVRTAITIYYFATEEISGGQAIYHPRDPTMNSETYHYKRGANQTFSQSTHIVDPSKFPEDEWQYNPDKEMLPIVIQCVVDEVEQSGHSHITLAVVEKMMDGGGYVLKPLKQKQMVDGLCYLLQEIYGIENKSSEREKIEDEIEDTGSECVICMVDIRDTLILPCRHLCLCSMCADNLRYQSNNCPICRAPFRALLQIRAMRKKLPGNQLASQTQSDEENTLNQEGVPPGYEAVSLIDALNGPNNPPNPNTVHYDGLAAPPASTMPSLPTSPEESPILNKRKKRQSSIRSQRSLNSSAVMEEAEEPPEDKVAKETAAAAAPAAATAVATGRTTPEILAADQKSVSRSGSQASLKKSHSKSSIKSSSSVDSARKAVGEKSSVEMVNETAKEKKEEEEEKKEDAVVSIVAEPEDKNDNSRPATPTQQEDTTDTKDIPDAESTKPPHDGVIYDAASDAEADTTDEPCLPSQVDNISLPGMPITTCGSSGSSYSSTSSSHALLSPGGTLVKSSSQELHPSV